MRKKPKEEKMQPDAFARFENLTKNLISVSNVEVREIMAEEKRQKAKGGKQSKQKVR
jgi:hypothetical protein